MWFEIPDLSPHQVGGVLGLVGIFGYDHRDRLSHVSHPAFSENGLAVRIETTGVGHSNINRGKVQIGRGQHGNHAGGLRGFGRFDPDEPTVGNR